MSKKSNDNKSKGGRPKIPVITGLPKKTIVLDQVLYWIDLQATQEEIAGMFYVCVETLNSRLIEHYGMGFSELKKRCAGSAKLSLRRFQFKLAEKSTAMAIWLGKQWLGQRDHDESKDGTPPNDVILTSLLSELKALKELQALKESIHGRDDESRDYDVGSILRTELDCIQQDNPPA